MATVKDIIVYLQYNYSPCDHVACAIWDAVDLLDLAEANNTDREEPQALPTLEDANNAIDLIHDRQDNSIGITWDTLLSALDKIEDGLA